MKKCSMCERELPDEQFSNRKGVQIYTRCKECRYAQQKKSLAKHKVDMPWYDEWILNDRVFRNEKYEEYKKSKRKQHLS